MKNSVKKFNFVRIKFLLVSIFVFLSLLFAFSSGSRYIVSANPLDDAFEKSENLKKEASRLQKEIEKQEKALDDHVAYKEVLDLKSSNVQKQINLFQTEIDNLNITISATNADIEKTIVFIEKKSLDVEALIHELGLSIRNVEKNGSFSSLQIILNSESYSDYLLMSKALEVVAKKEQEVKTKLENETKLLEIEKEALSVKQEVQKNDLTSLSLLIMESESQKSELKSLQEKTTALIHDIEGELSHNHQALGESQEELDAIEDDIQKLIEANKPPPPPPTTTSASTTTQAPTTTTMAGSTVPGQTTLPGQTTPTTPPTTIGGAFWGNYLNWPVPYTRNITSTYGYRWGSLHKGIDIATSGVDGKNAVSAASGKVTWANHGDSWGGGYGHFVMIDHGYDQNNNHVVTLYAHNQKLLVNAGQTVEAGQALSVIGNTGDSYGSHLHFEVRVNGTAVDPLLASKPYLKP